MLRANSAVNLEAHKMSQSAAADAEQEAAAVDRKAVTRGNTDTILNQSDERIDRLREGLRTMFREHVPTEPPARKSDRKQEGKPSSFWRGRGGSGGATIGGAISALSLARAAKRVPSAAAASPSPSTAEPMAVGSPLGRISRP